MEATMNTPPKLLYPALVVAAISVTLFSLLGIATLTGHLPIAHSTPQELLADSAATTASPATLPTREAATARTSPPAPVRTAAPRKVAGDAEPGAGAVSCAACGTVESISVVERKGDGTGIGAVAGGVTGALLGNQIGKGNGRTGMAILGGAGGALLGNRIEQDMRRTTSYRINVRMDSGHVRTLYQRMAPDVAVGRQVEIVGNTVVPRT